jgi:hypothetical protein
MSNITNEASKAQREAVVAGLIYVAGFAGLGFVIGEYHPVFSDMMTMYLCKPFSPCRDQAAEAYSLVGALVGVVVAVWFGSRHCRRSE